VLEEKECWILCDDLYNLRRFTELPRTQFTYLRNDWIKYLIENSTLISYGFIAWSLAYNAFER